MATQTFLIPLTNIPQKFEIDLAGVTYNLTVKWNDLGEFWILDIADTNDNSIVAALPLITGRNLLDGLSYLGIDGELFVYTNTGGIPTDMPNLDTLGVDSNLYFTTSAANG